MKKINLTLAQLTFLDVCKQNKKHLDYVEKKNGADLNKRKPINAFRFGFNMGCYTTLEIIRKNCLKE
jgi:hypothetical protein